MAAVAETLRTGDPSALEKLLVGRQLWAVHPALERPNLDSGGMWHDPASISGPFRSLSLKQFLPAEGDRKKHIVQLWCDPGGMRTLTVGSIRFKDPGRSAGAKRRAARERGSGVSS